MKGDDEKMVISYWMFSDWVVGYPRLPTCGQGF